MDETGYRRFIRFLALDHRYSYPLDWPRWGHLYAPEVETIEQECLGAEIGLDQGEPVLEPNQHTQYPWLQVQQALALLVWPEKSRGPASICRHTLVHAGAGSVTVDVT